MNATDADGDVIYYSLLGDALAAQFFYIDEESGIVSLKRLLTEGVQSQYNLRVSLFSLYLVVLHFACSRIYSDKPLSIFNKQNCYCKIYNDLKRKMRLGITSSAIRHSGRVYRSYSILDIHFLWEFVRLRFWHGRMSER